jgi:2-dehydro-3-deoxyphosphooctonate aldolase (KDO 8-P synthase)
VIEVNTQIRVGQSDDGRVAPLALIAGPCVIESEEHVHFLAREIRKLAGAFIFKASFDKANRSSVNSYRGPGLKEGLRILKGVRDAGFAVLTDIHEPAQAALAAESADILQIPAFLCRQTDLLVEAGRTGRVVNIKKGQFIAPLDIRQAADKVASTGNNRILLTERGTTFGYNNLVVDMRGLAMMRGLGWPVVFDATHSVQLPGASGTASGGQPEFIGPLSRAGGATCGASTTPRMPALEGSCISAGDRGARQWAPASFRSRRLDGWFHSRSDRFAETGGLSPLGGPCTI